MCEYMKNGTMGSLQTHLELEVKCTVDQTKCGTALWDYLLKDWGSGGEEVNQVFNISI